MNGPARIAPEESGFRDGRAWGAMAAAWSSGAEIELLYAEGRPVDPGHPLDWMPRHAHPPTVTWTCERESGPFSLADFLAIHMGAEDASAFSIRVEGEAHLPFLALHPSGQMQAIRYDPYEESFRRRVLYATLRLESAIALAEGMAAGSEEEPQNDRDSE